MRVTQVQILYSGYTVVSTVQYLVYPVVPPPATDCDQDFREFVREYTAQVARARKILANVCRGCKIMLQNYFLRNYFYVQPISSFYILRPVSIQQWHCIGVRYATIQYTELPLLLRI